MFAILYLFAVFSGFCLKRLNVLFSIGIIILISFICYGVKDRDFEQYQIVYDYIKEGNQYTDLGIAWAQMCKAAGWMGLDYASFKLIVIIISLVIIYKAINSFLYSKSGIPFFWSCFLIFPLFLDLVQVRFFFAESILLFGFQYLLKNNKTGKWKFILLVLLASSIHSSIFFFLIFILIPYVDKFKKKMPFLVSILCIISFYAPSIAVSLATKFINVNRIERYFFSSDRTGFLGIITAILTLYCFLFITKKIRDSEIIDKNFGDFLYKSNLLMWFLLPIVFFDPNIFRIQRPMWLMLYIEAISFTQQSHSPYLLIWKKKKIHIKQFIFLLAIFGNLAFITIYSFDIIQKFLFH
jgi:hypothetical protein